VDRDDLRELLPRRDAALRRGAHGADVGAAVRDRLRRVLEERGLAENEG